MKKKFLFLMASFIAAVMVMLFAPSFKTYAASSSLNAGEANTAYYVDGNRNGMYLSLDDLRNYYLKRQVFSSVKISHGGTGFQSKYKNYSALGNCMYIKDDDPIASFVPKSCFTTIGDHVNFGSEYGYYVHTERAINDSTVPFYGAQEGEAFFSYVYLIDIETRMSYEGNNKLVYVTANLVVNNAFFTLKSTALNRDNRRGVSLVGAKYDQVISGSFVLDSSIIFESGFITVPAVDGYSLSSFGTVTLDNVYMVKPTLAMSVDNGCVASVRQLTTPTNYKPNGNNNNSADILDTMNQTVEYVIGKLPTPFNYVSDVISIGRIVASGARCTSEDLTKYGTKDSNLDSVDVTVNSQAYVCDFDSALREINKEKADKCNGVLIYEPNSTYRLFEAKTTFTSDADIFAIAFDCDFITARKVKAGNMFYSYDYTNLTTTKTNSSRKRCARTYAKNGSNYSLTNPTGYVICGKGTTIIRVSNTPSC